MTTPTIGRRSGGIGARRAGYAVAAGVNGVLLLLINVTPGWAILPFLTPDMSIVLPWINASMVVGILSNVVNLVRDTPRVKGIGDLITGAVGLVAMIVLWQVFPFDFGAEPNGWSTVTRVVLLIGIVGTAIALIVSFVIAVRGGHRAVAS